MVFSPAFWKFQRDLQVQGRCLSVRGKWLCQGSKLLHRMGISLETGLQKVNGGIIRTTLLFSAAVVGKISYLSPYNENIGENDKQ